jgi:hypothetical protein
MGVLGVAGVTTNSGGPWVLVLVDDEAAIGVDASKGRVVVLGGVVVILNNVFALTQTGDLDWSGEMRLERESPDSVSKLFRCTM